MTSWIRSLFVPSLALVLCIACGGGGDDAAPTPDADEPSASEQPAPAPAPAAEPEPTADPAIVDAAARAEAKEIFETRCVTCHGPAGKGDGPGSAGLSPPPRNFQDPEWQASVSDEHIEQIIQYGGAAVGKSPTMPANPDLNSKPAVVTALREYIRGLEGG